MQLAKAQVSVGIGVNIGTPVHRVVVERPYYYDDFGRVVYYERPVYATRYYARPVYRTRYYTRPVYRNVVVYNKHYYHGRGPGRGWGHGHGHGHGRH
ncbi:hypothetical protein GWR56_11790 [Mucilaginibacter sp. 14171R-50]|nr:hypothetical protein GWR56_11790 [Mucilaginibacter sp. 14171R-50]